LRNEVPLAFRICNVIVSPVLDDKRSTDLLQFQKLICGCVSCSWVDYPLREVPIPLIWKCPPNRFPAGYLSIPLTLKHGKFFA
jgi:hypothetical protein